MSLIRFNDKLLHCLRVHYNPIHIERTEILRDISNLLPEKFHEISKIFITEELRHAVEITKSMELLVFR